MRHSSTGLMGEQEDIQVLVARARSGHRDAFDRLTCHYRSRLQSVVGSRLGEGLRQHVTMDDVLQETLLRAWRSIETFRWRGRDSFFRWLCGIATRVVLEAAGKHKHARWQPLDPEMMGGSVSPSKALRREERFALLRKALDGLPRDYRDVLTLVRLEGLSVTETARRLNRSPNAVSHLLLRALRKLRENLADTESLGLPDRSLKETQDDPES